VSRVLVGLPSLHPPPTSRRVLEEKETRVRTSRVMDPYARNESLERVAKVDEKTETEENGEKKDLSLAAAAVMTLTLKRVKGTGERLS
jgi:ribonuclease HIII